MNIYSVFVFLGFVAFAFVAVGHFLNWILFGISPFDSGVQSGKQPQRENAARPEPAQKPPAINEIGRPSVARYDEYMDYAEKEKKFLKRTDVSSYLRREAEAEVRYWEGKARAALGGRSAPYRSRWSEIEAEEKGKENGTKTENRN